MLAAGPVTEGRVVTKGNDRSDEHGKFDSDAPGEFTGKQPVGLHGQMGTVFLCHRTHGHNDDGTGQPFANFRPG